MKQNLCDYRSGNWVEIIQYLCLCRGRSTLFGICRGRSTLFSNQCYYSRIYISCLSIHSVRTSVWTMSIQEKDNSIYHMELMKRYTSLYTIIWASRRCHHPKEKHKLCGQSAGLAACLWVGKENGWVDRFHTVIRDNYCGLLQGLRWKARTTVRMG